MTKHDDVLKRLKKLDYDKSYYKDDNLLDLINKSQRIIDGKIAIQKKIFKENMNQDKNQNQEINGSIQRPKRLISNIRH